MYTNRYAGLAALLFALSFACGAWADPSASVRALQQRWAEVNYQLEGKTQLTAFEQLVADAQSVLQRDTTNADAWIWSGIIKSSYAGAKGGLGALKLAKAAKADLEQAMALDPDAMQGSAYTSLGTLYANVPGWPLGFGDGGRAEELLQKALAINPTGIDSNYFYGDYLLQEKRFAEAREYLRRAQQAPARPDRLLADEGRQQEIAAALAQVQAKLAR